MRFSFFFCFFFLLLSFFLFRFFSPFFLVREGEKARREKNLRVFYLMYICVFFLSIFDEEGRGKKNYPISLYVALLRKIFFF